MQRASINRRWLSSAIWHHALYDLNALALPRQVSRAVCVVVVSNNGEADLFPAADAPQSKRERFVDAAKRPAQPCGRHV
ncbi:hypothetical protein KCP74_13775 [Salmonella enterica subsp. enterica]|nr:hypothetical protein KCP74_13775 [Salmonella enterica subsp. enterica]